MPRRAMAWFAVLPLTLAVTFPGDTPVLHGSQPARLVTTLRRPAAATLLPDGRTVCVANRRSGSVSIVDLHAGRVVAELAVGTALAGITVAPDGKHMLVVDEEKHELIVLAVDGTRLTPRCRLGVAPYPVSVVVLPGGKASVATLWSRTLELIDLSALSTAGSAPRLRTLHTIRLPFAPRLQCVLPEGRLAVADSFGGGLAVIDTAAGQLTVAHELAGHNIRGLAVSADSRNLLVAHQLIDSKVPITKETIRTGELLGNVLRRLPLDHLNRADEQPEKHGSLISLGGVGAGAGDPAGVALSGDGRVAVALAGVNEVALLAPDGRLDQRVGVGRCPTAVLAIPHGRLVVVNSLDDSLSVLNQGGAVVQTIELGPQPKLGFRERGEQLFYDARLSYQGWMSCHSCHTDGHTSGVLADTLGDGTHGTPKRTLTLLGTRLSDPWAWDGSMKYLHDQVEKSLEQTMHAPTLAPAELGDLVSFVASLAAPPPFEPPGDDADRTQIERGRKVFEDRGCVRCHIPPVTYSSHGTFDVGFADEAGLRKFNPPSLRGVGHGRRLLHDGRAGSLAEVFTKFKHKVGDELRDEDRADLLRFLRSL